MDKKRLSERKIVHSLADVPAFVSEEQERAWWSTHDLAEGLGVDMTEQHQALVRRLKAKYRYMSRTAPGLRVASFVPLPSRA